MSSRKSRWSTGSERRKRSTSGSGSSPKRPPQGWVLTNEASAGCQLCLPPGQHFPGQSADLGRRSAQLLVEAPALQAADLGEEERIVALPTLEVDRPLEEVRGDGPIDDLLGGGDERIQGVLQRMEPGSVIDEVGPLPIDIGLVLDLLLGQAELLQVVVQLEQHECGGGFVQLTRLEPHDP